MKFGHNLPRNQVPEWAASYINYKGLKKLVRVAASAAKEGRDPDLAEFFYSLDRNLEDVDGFYNKKYGDAARRLRLLHDRYGPSAQALHGIDKDEAEDLMGALLELRGQLRKLQWYGEVNRRGFVKITKKLDKKVPRICTQQRYLTTKVYPRPFSANQQLIQDMNAINEWLSILSEVKSFDDSSSVHSTNSLRSVGSRTITIPQALQESLNQAIRSDDGISLLEILHQANITEDRTAQPFQRLLLNLLQRSINLKAKQCIGGLLDQITTLSEEDDLNERNCIHRLVIAIGRSKTSEASVAPKSSEAPSEKSQFIIPAESPMLLPPVCTTTEQESLQLLSKNDESVCLLAYLLGRLRPHQRSALKARDSYGRFPLHYAAQYGFVVICQTVIKHMQDWGQFDVSHGIDSPEWQDSEGFAPLHLSVIGGHPLTTKALLDAESWQGNASDIANNRKTVSKSGVVLALATKANFVRIVKLLVEAGVNINYQDEQGETALHVAARFGHESCAKTLLEGSLHQKTEIDIPEKTFAWTPLFIACVDGHLPIVELLIQAGADLDRADLSGWTAKEHAALRGHMDIAWRLAAVTTSLGSLAVEVSQNGAKTAAPSSLHDRRSANIAKESIRISEPVKTFGHRYLTKETMILVSLGSMDYRKAVPAVKLDNIPLTDAHSTQLDTALSLIVSAAGASGEPTVIDLPIQENISTDPITFTTMDAAEVKLLFDIVPTYAGSKDRIAGRGVALLSTVKTSVGSKRMPLQGDVSVPIVAANTLEVIGLVNFNFLIITPFSHPNMSITENHTYWKKMTSTMVIGHRGLGKNSASRKSLQLGENTIQSFIAAANLGASYVEFDVQLTKDHVPVIYHDFLVSETGIDAPVHTLTLEQFLHISEHQSSRPSGPSSPEVLGGTDGDSPKTPFRRPRSYSLGTSEDRAVEMSERMKHTRDFKMKGFKGNSRGNFIQAPFTTLEEILEKLPESIGFNIEMKYPMLSETEEHEMDAYAVELNSFVDTVLTTVYNLGKKRHIIFSSFNPDICLLLSFKQPSIPVLFLTDAGTCRVSDIRASSLQEAIRFASRWNLLGIVAAAEPLVTCPRLVKVVKESGLVCVSYGTLNNDPQNVNLQVNEGIDAVIVDSVLAIRKGLTGSDTQSALPTSENVSPASVRRIVDTVNGVPIYENGNEFSVHGAVFSS